MGLNTALSKPSLCNKARILEMISTNKIVVISGNTGCGKSTQIPKYIYQENNNNKILITQPRRIAAISIAKRIAAELNETVGNKIRERNL